MESRAGYFKGNINCPKCAQKEGNKKLYVSFEVALARAKSKHGNVYKYDSSTYIAFKYPMIMECKLHGKFTKSMQEHCLAERPGGCPLCASSGFSRSKEGTLYYLRVQPFNGVVLYKIGITNNSVEQRFSSSDLSIITVLNTVHYQNGEDCHQAEKKIKREFKEFRYTGSDVLISGGNTELFTKDILGLDLLVRNY